MGKRQFIDMPDTMARLPRDRRGYPVPEFVHWQDGVPDFRIIKHGWRETCHSKHRCWLCGGGMGARKWFVIGPMCSVTRTTMEPPSHKLCAEFAVKNCPFMTMPLARRNERGLDQYEDKWVPGTGIDRNPGVMIIWETRSYKPFRVDDSWLIEVGPPAAVTAWREGRRASREELVDSVKSGLPLLQAEAVKDGPDALRDLDATVMRWGHDVLDRFFPKADQRQAAQ